MSSSPRHIGAGLSTARQALEAAQPPQTRRRPDWDDDPEVVEARKMELDAERQSMRWLGQCPSLFLDADVDDFADYPTAGKPPIPERLRTWAEEPGARNLVLLGPVGSGKSRAACAACRVLSDRGIPMTFVPAEEMLDAVFSRNNRDAIDDYCRADVLVIDDLACEAVSDWERKRIYLIVNRRYIEQRRTVVTTNLEPKGLEEAVGERTYSRLIGERAVVLKLSGKDRRRGR